ncbi:astacin [Necator americanus]|uniref:Metalloendopeptidase n=1 Tax=Necator americanus TaxID=51031 RepID=W2SFB2_NECAM|nr:astacin [Necator americanus]ETN68289.1 astacin [Necator americanus]
MIFLSAYCETFRSAAHELGHTLGLFQQESREDRDKYVKIVTENLELNQVYMSFKQTRYTNEYYDIGYDFGDIMQAGAQSGSINGNRTIDSIDPKYRKNLRSESISFADLYLVNKRYNCSDLCRRRIRCRNGGFQHPRNCEICVCPSGYAGPRCGQKPPPCGSKETAEKKWKTLIVNLKIGKGRWSLDGYKTCTYWIKSPNNTRIEMRIRPRKSPFKDSDLYCNEAGVEVKAIKDQRLTGYKFCSSGDRYNLTSHSNLVPIIAFNRDPLPENVSLDRTQVFIKYRYR